MCMGSSPVADVLLLMCRTERRAAIPSSGRLAEADSRVEEAVGDVDERVDGDGGDGGEGDDSRDERVVERLDGVDAGVPEPWDVEDRLDEQCAAECDADIDA